MWSRQLLSRIEEPMQLFAKNKSLMAMKESKKVIKLYNRVSAESPAVLQAYPLICCKHTQPQQHKCAPVSVHLSSSSTWFQGLDVRVAGCVIHT